MPPKGFKLPDLLTGLICEYCVVHKVCVDDAIDIIISENYDNERMSIGELIQKGDDLKKTGDWK